MPHNWRAETAADQRGEFVKLGSEAMLPHMYCKLHLLICFCADGCHQHDNHYLGPGLKKAPTSTTIRPTAPGTRAIPIGRVRTVAAADPRAATAAIPRMVTAAASQTATASRTAGNSVSRGATITIPTCTSGTMAMSPPSRTETTRT